MAHIVLGIGTSHTPLLALPGDMWETYARGDRTNPELVFPPDGWAMKYDEALANYVPKSTQDRLQGPEEFEANAQRCQAALDELAKTLQDANPDVTVIISDDQDEWFFDSNMPAFAIYWGDTVPIIPRAGGAPGWDPEMAKLIGAGYGDIPLDVPVASNFARFLIENLMENDFDIAQLNYIESEYGGTVARRYPTPKGELDSARTTKRRPQGLPHGFAFVVKRLFDNKPGPIVPVIQNTCYPPNNVVPKRCYKLGRAVARAVEAWDEDLSVAVVASGGLSHFVVDEELDRTLLTALEKKDAETMQSLPRHRLYSATSESLNWVTLGGALEDSPLQMSLIDYVPVYRTEAGTGGGWAFATWT